MLTLGEIREKQGGGLPIVSVGAEPTVAATGGASFLYDTLRLPGTSRQTEFPDPKSLAQYHLGARWEDSAHFDLINERLLKLERRELRGVVLLLPPQHGKSTNSSLIFPCWYLSRHPTHYGIITSYQSSYAQDWSRQCRNLIEEHSHILGISLDPSNRAKDWWSLSQGGRIAAAGLDAGITGKPAHFIVVDDPVKNFQQAHSPILQQHVWDNFLTAVRSRLQPHGIVVVLMTWWAVNDFAGRIASQYGGDPEWEIVRLPALAEDKDPLGRQRGEALWEGRYSREELLRIRDEIGEYHFNAIYQQRPSKSRPDQEGFIAGKWVQTCMDLPRNGAVRRGVDIGLDVARSPQGDSTVFYEFNHSHGAIVNVTVAHQDTMATANEAAARIIETEARSIRIDDTGVGGGVTDRLFELQGEATAPLALRRCEIIPMSFGSSPFDPERFADTRTELWWNVMELCKAGGIRLPTEQQLFDDLVAPMVQRTSNNRLKLESKDSLARRGISSPDHGDALALACYPDEWVHRAGVM